MKYIREKYWLGLSVVLVAGLWFGYGLNHSGPEKSIARVGNRTIDWKMLNRSFELNPKWGKGLTNEEAYFNQLNYLIDEKLFAQTAEEDGLDKDSEISKYLNFIRVKELIKGLYRTLVSSRVEISDKEYEQGYTKLKKKVVLNYIYTPDFQHSLRYYQSWQKSDFNDIQLIDTASEMKGTTQPLSFGEVEPELENVVFDLNFQEISNPIPVADGFMIVQLASGTKELFMSETDFALNKNRIRKVIYDRKAGKIANSYIKDLMKDKNLKMNPPIFYALSNELSKIVKNKYSEDPLPIYINDQEINTTQNHLQEILPEVLITYKDGQMTAGDFLMNLNGMPPNLRPRVNMAPQLKNAIGVMVRNKFLAKQAMEMGLEKNPEVIREIEIQSDQLLAKYWLLTKEKEIEVSEREIEDFKISKRFEELKQRLGDTPTSEQIRDILIDYKFQIEKMKLSESMRNQLPVKIDSLELQRNIKKPDQKIKNDPIRFVYRELFN
jgi:hypothetical protein